jgi:hypothetical protein
MISSKDGSAEKSKGSTVNIESIRIRTDPEILRVSKISRRKDGSGITIMTTTETIPIAAKMSVFAAKRLRAPILVAAITAPPFCKVVVHM